MQETFIPNDWPLCKRRVALDHVTPILDIHQTERVMVNASCFM